MMKKLVLPLLLLSLFCFDSISQDTLPNFSLKNVGNNRIIVSWNNKFEVVKQISIQRSADSLNGYRTILTVADPDLPQNGFVDTKAPNDRMFYRLYILLDKGMFLFSNAKRPELDTSRRNIGLSDPQTRMNGIDSVNTPNLPFNNKSRPEVFTPSLHVYTYRDGYVRVNLPDDEQKKYSIRFFEEDDTFLFELKDIKERTFKLDKANFYHGGWFKFELYENDKLKEKHKFFLQKDF